MGYKTKILLTGASGTVGHEVLKQLFPLRQKYDIVVFGTRSKRSLKLLSPFREGIKIVHGDISNFSDVANTGSNFDLVIHLAAVIPPLADEKPELAYKINTTGTSNLIRHLELTSPGAFYLYSSSISVYGDRLKNPMIKVGDQLIPSKGDEYAKTKINAEECIRNSKLDWSIFRLTAIMGNHKASKLMFHMPLDTSIEIASPEDTARAFILALDKRERLSKRIFNLGGGESCRTTYREILRGSFEVFGLGELNFPDKTFAEKNFHCGYYADGDELENILHFRRDNLESYYKLEKLKIPAWRKTLTYILQKPVKYYLFRQSEPYKAFKTRDAEMIDRFFGNL